MTRPAAPIDWPAHSEEEQLAIMNDLGPEDLCAAARTYDWDGYPETVLGTAMARKNIDLCTALIVFFNGRPERFNYVPKRDVPEALRPTARLLDAICLRINSGFYLAHHGGAAFTSERLSRWLEFQRLDAIERRRGRWILDEHLLATAFQDKAVSPQGAETDGHSKNSLLRDLLSPVIGLGVDRDILKYRTKDR